MIQYRRGKTHIMNVDGRRERTCECYTTVKKRMKYWWAVKNAGVVASGPVPHIGEPPERLPADTGRSLTT
jgi:hypothetical protein